jgi:pimeloyl-ACP methyl ester carboxylesterase
MSEMGFFRHCNAPLERHFTVVHWDQRGTGKSFDRNIPRSSMTLDQFVADLDELVDIVRRRFRKEKVAILGHSWGSALGAIYAARFPEKVSVYVGAAQIGDWAGAESLSYSFGLAEAERRHDEKALKKLRAIGPPPYPTAKSVFIERTAVNRIWKRLLGRGQRTPRSATRIDASGSRGFTRRSRSTTVSQLSQAMTSQ